MTYSYTELNLQNKFCDVEKRLEEFQPLHSSLIYPPAVSGHNFRTSRKGNESLALLLPHWEATRGVITPIYRADFNPPAKWSRRRT